MSGAIDPYLAIPESCHLGKRIFKNLLLGKAPLGAADKKALQQDVDAIVWQYTLKPATIPIAAYRDGQREYLEIAVLLASLNRANRMERIAEVVHRAIPYPVFLVLEYESQFCISLASKRFNQADPTTIVADGFFATHLISTAHVTPAEAEFLASLSINELPQTNFYAMYHGWIARVVAVQCARLTGEYRLLPPGADLQLRCDRLAECHRLEEQVAALRRALRAETQFNRQVELNMRVKALQKELARMVGGL